MKKIPGDIIILHIWTINDDHMMYGSWVMERNQVLCHLDHFLPFYPPNNWENQNFEKMKKNPGDILLHSCVPQMTIIHCKFPEIWSVMDIIFCHFGPSFSLLPPLPDGRTDRRTDRERKMWYIQVATPSKNDKLMHHLNG